MSFRIKPKTIKARFYSDREQEYLTVLITGHTEGKFIPGDRFSEDEYPEVIITEVECDGVDILPDLNEDEVRELKEIFSEN